MTIGNLKNSFLKQLSEFYPEQEILSFHSLLLQHRLEINRVEQSLRVNEILKNSDIHYLLEALEQLVQQKPIQYIIGTTSFYGLDIKVNKEVLIPRPETEELVDWILKDNENKTGLRILEIGTGSGCIAIALAKNLNKAVVYGLDISKNAIKLAMENAKINKTKVHFIEEDILKMKSISNQNEDLKFDIIVSNPPYIRVLEKNEIKPNVLNYEPHIALFVDTNDPLLFYKSICDFAKENIIKGGALYFEINQYLGRETTLVLEQKGISKTELKKDLFGNDRMLKGYYQ